MVIPGTNCQLNSRQPNRWNSCWSYVGTFKFIKEKTYWTIIIHVFSAFLFCLRFRPLRVFLFSFCVRFDWDLDWHLHCRNDFLCVWHSCWMKECKVSTRSGETMTRLLMMPPKDFRLHERNTRLPCNFWLASVSRVEYLFTWWRNKTVL